MPDLTPSDETLPSLPDIALPAERAGLLDVAYSTLDSPVGELLLAATPKGLARIAYLGPEDGEQVLEDLATRLSPRILRAPRRLDECRRELDEYFTKRRRRFEIPLDWTLTGGFGRRVLRATARIPYGGASTYAEIARRAGNPRAYRAAGTALGRNPLPIIVPCHRVLHFTGGLGGYTGGLERKRALLEVEESARP